MKISSESKKAGIEPPSNPEDLDTFRNSLDPDSMGFDGVEGGYTYDSNTEDVDKV